MTQAKHTQGPWKILPFYGAAGENFLGYDVVECKEPSDRIAIVKLTDTYHGDKDKCTERANLIAAAPDLLEACKASHMATTQKELDRAVKLIAAAIAKAEGGAA